MTVVTVYTVKRVPHTAAAKSSAGYIPILLEFVAESPREAVVKAIDACEWRDPATNFSWLIQGSRVLEVEPPKES